MSLKKTLPFFAVLLAGLLAAVPMRTGLILTEINPETGFYYHPGSSLVFAVNCLIVAVPVLLLIPLFLPSFRDLTDAPRASAGFGVFSLVIGGCFVIDACWQFCQLVTPSASASMLFNSIGAFASAGFFVMFGFFCLRGGKIALPVASLMPVIWGTVHLMASFMHYTTVVSISEYLFDMLKMVFVMLFFYYHARYTGGVSNRKELRGMLAYGLPAVFFSLVSTLPRYIAALMGGKASLDPVEDILYTLLAAYIVTLILRLHLRREEGRAAPLVPGAAGS